MKALDRFGPEGPWLGLYCLVAGLCDAGTGLALVLFPQATLDLLRLPAVAEPIYLRFVGVFVAQTGLAYLYPWWRRTGEGTPPPVAVLFELTALARLSVATFLGVALVAGSLATPWLLVLVTDLVLALAQVAWLGTGDLDPCPSPNPAL